MYFKAISHCTGEEPCLIKYKKKPTKKNKKNPQPRNGSTGDFKT